MIRADDHSLLMRPGPVSPGPRAGGRCAKSETPLHFQLPMYQPRLALYWAHWLDYGTTLSFAAGYVTQETVEAAPKK